MSQLDNQISMYERSNCEFCKYEMILMRYEYQGGWIIDKKILKDEQRSLRSRKAILIKEDLMVQNRDLESTNLVASYSGHFIVAF